MCPESSRTAPILALVQRAVSSTAASMKSTQSSHACSRVSDVQVDALERRADLHGDGGTQGPLRQGPKPDAQRRAVAQCLLRGRIGMSVALRELEQLVGRRDDVLDRRAVLRLEQRDRVDQHRLVRNQLGRPLQLGHSSTRFDARLQDPSGFQVMSRRQPRQFVVGHIRAPSGPSSRHVLETGFLRHNWAICRR